MRCEAVESIYAYPMAKLTREVETKPLSSKDAAEVRKWLRVALAAEAAGLIQAAIDSTVAHLSVRQQFGQAARAAFRRFAIAWRNAPCWPAA